MTPGNLELVQIVVSWAVTVPAVIAVIVYDERRLSDDLLERAWTRTSRDAAIFGLWNMGVHPLCVFIHFARTRRSVIGVFWGLGWLLLILLIDAGIQTGASFVIDWLGV